MAYKVLLVDDDPDILEFLGYNLKNEGYTVETAENGVQAIEKTKEFEPDIIILDVMMPEMDGVEACQEIRKFNKDSIIVFLTARGEDYSQIVGLESGADDYITKPIKPKVFIARLKAILRRKETGDKEILNEHFKIDKERYVIILNNEEYLLPKKEFEIIELLASKPEKVFTREEIYQKIWGDVYVGDRTIDVHIRKIREKLGEDIIKTVKGVGYKFQL